MSVNIPGLSSPTSLSLSGARPERHGQKWTPEEEVDLLSNVEEGKSIDVIASEHKRSNGGITAHLKVMACSYYDDGLSQTDITRLTRVTEAELTQELEKRASKPSREVKERQPPPAMSGERWTEREDAELLSEVESGHTPDMIAERHSRTRVGIIFRLKHLARNFHGEGLPLQEIVRLTGLNAEQVNQAITVEDRPSFRGGRGRGWSRGGQGWSRR